MELLAGVGILAVPGLLLGVALGLRGWLLAASAAPLTYGIVAAAGSALPFAGIRWSPLTLLVVTVVAAGVAAAARLLARRRWSPAPRPSLPAWRAVHHLGVAMGVAVAAAVGVAATVYATRGFTAVPQIWDAFFHSNAIRFIADTGLSDPAALRGLNDPTSPNFFYPNAYHVVAATVVQLTGSGVPAVVDASVAQFTAVLALGFAALVRGVRGRPALAAATALLSCAFTAFPYDLLPWGTLLPFIAAVTVVPAFLALVSALLGRTSLPVANAVATAVVGVGLLGLHPSVAIAAALFTVLLLVQRWITERPGRTDLAALAVTVAAAVVAGAPLLVATARAVGTRYNWVPTLSPVDALGELVFAGHAQPFPQWWLAGLTVLGLAAGRSLVPLRWLLVGGAFFAGLFVLAAAYEGGLAAVLTQPWWDDKWRLAALWTLAAIPLAAGGLVAVQDAVLGVAVRLLTGERRRLVASVAVLGILAALVVVASNGLYLDRNRTRLAVAFADGPAVSDLERAAYDQLSRLVPPGSYVMNDAYDGSAMMWALDDVRPVFASPVIASQELATMDPRRLVLFQAFDQVDHDQAVQDALAAFHVDYVLVGQGMIPPADAPAPGMRDLAGARHLQLVYRNADASIYRIDWAALRAARAQR